MNIYLDIDGVLLVNEAHAANHADDFLHAVLEKFPNSTYWLTAHNQNGDKGAKQAFTRHLKPETIALLDKVKTAKWRELKTDAIDFNEDFLWFGSELWQEELNILEKHEVAERFIMVKLDKDPDMLQKLMEVVKNSAA